MHGRYTGDVFTFMNTVNYTCDQGYDMLGPDSLICEASGNYLFTNFTVRGPWRKHLNFVQVSGTTFLPYAFPLIAVICPK